MLNSYFKIKNMMIIIMIKNNNKLNDRLSIDGFQKRDILQLGKH